MAPMANGYIKLHRKLIRSDWYKNQEAKSLFIHCLLKANYEEAEFRGVKIQAGSFATSRRKLAAELGMTERSVRTAMKVLEASGTIETITTQKTTQFATQSKRLNFTIVTVKKWSQYQLSDPRNDPKNDHNIRNIKKVSAEPVGIAEPEKKKARHF